MKKVPFEMSKKQKKHIERVNNTWVLIAQNKQPKTIPKAKFDHRGRQANKDSLYGRQRDVCQFIKLTKGEK